MAESLVFGLSLPAKDEEELARFDTFVAWLAKKSGLAISRLAAHSYEALATGMSTGAFDIAWLPPIVHIRVEPEKATPIACVTRGEKGFHAALIVREDSHVRSLDALRGSRAAWVDPWSAAGFVIPRINLLLRGVDPRSLFRAEAFHGSHSASVRAVIDGAADVTGTYAHVDGEGEVKSGGWSGIPDANVRVLATFGAVPNDVVVTRSSIPEETRAAIVKALLEAKEDEEILPVLEKIFGGKAFEEPQTSGYEELRKAIDSSKGLFDS